MSNSPETPTPRNQFAPALYQTGWGVILMPLVGLIVTIISFFFIDTQWVKFTLGGIGIASFLLAGYLFLVVFRHWKKQIPDAPFIQFFRSLVYDAENLSEGSGMIPRDFEVPISEHPAEEVDLTQSDEIADLTMKLAQAETDVIYWKEKHANVMATYEHTPPTYITENERLQGWFNKYDWLVTDAKEQALNIASHLEIKRIVYSESDILEGHTHFFITFALTISNTSVFPITFEPIKGNLIFEDTPLGETPRFENEVPPVIPPRDATGGVLRIVQRLTPLEAESIKRAMERHEKALIDAKEKRSGGIPVASRIKFHNLILTAKSEDGSVKPTEMHRTHLIFDISKRNLNFSSVQKWTPDEIKPLISVVEEDTKSYDVHFGDRGKMIIGGGAEGKMQGWGFGIRFYSEPTDFPDVPIEIKAIIKFTNVADGEVTRVNDGVWDEEETNYKVFRTGDAGDLMVAYYDTKQNLDLHNDWGRISTYEYKKGKPFSGQQIFGDIFQLDIELIGKYENTHVMRQNFKFTLSRKPVSIKQVYDET